MRRSTPLTSRIKPALLPILGLVVLALALPGIATASDPVAEAAATGQPYVPGQVVVQYEGQNAPATVSVPDDANVKAVANRLERKKAVESATPNYIAKISDWLPNDPGIGRGHRGKRGGWQAKQWNFLPCYSLCGRGASTSHQSLGGINALRAWRELRRAGRPGARGVKIAVLDTGVAYRNYRKHFRRDPDLSRRTFLRGRDFVDNDRLPLDRNGHGTHISSTIAQATNNNRGLTGIAYRAKLIPVRVMDANGYGTTANIIKGIRWATNHGARVISMSINFSCGVSIPALENVLAYAHSRGTVLVGSSGNKGSQTCPSLPATAPQVISVGGSTESGCVANYSFRSTAIDIAAPGGGSTTDGCPFRSGTRPILQVAMIGGNPSWFGIEPGWKGTSMAAAHVAAGAAMVIASKVLRNGKGPRKVKRRLLKTARLPKYARNDPVSGFGAGIMNLGRAVNPKVR